MNTGWIREERFGAFCYTFLTISLVGFVGNIMGIARNRTDTYWLAISMCTAFLNALLIFYWCFQLDEFCIDLAEAVKIGLRVEELPHAHERIAWDLYRLNKQKEEAEQQKKQREMEDALKSLPPDLLRQISSSRSDHTTLCASLKRKPEVRADVNEVASRVAAALLTQRGELTMSEIRAIPFVRDEADAQRVLTYLLDHLRAESGQRKVSSSPLLRWERYVRLKDDSKRTPAATHG